MTGMPLLIGQIITVAVFLAVGLGVIWWLFRPSAAREATGPIEEHLSRPQATGAAPPQLRVRVRPADAAPPPPPPPASEGRGPG